MGHQNHTIGLQLGFNNKWSSKWAVDIKNKEIYRYLTHQDLLIKAFIIQFFKKLKLQVLKPIIKRTENETHIFIGIFTKYKKIRVENPTHDINYLQTLLEQFTNTKVKCYYVFINNYLYDADLLGNFIVASVKANKKPLTIFKTILRKKTKLHKSSSLNFLHQKIQGIKYEISGRIKGVDRARTLKFLYGSVPLNTLSQKISFAKKTVYTKEGTLGVKVWITYK